MEESDSKQLLLHETRITAVPDNDMVKNLDPDDSADLPEPFGDQDIFLAWHRVA